MLAALAVMMLSLLCPAFAAKADLNKDARQSVVVVDISIEIEGMDENGNGTGEFYEEDLGWGTGFFIGKSGTHPSYLVTNYHVVADYVETGSGAWAEEEIDGQLIRGHSRLKVYYDSSDYEEAYLVDYDENKDLALLCLDSATSKREPLSLCSPTDDMVGTEVYAIGYPGLAEEAFENTSGSWGMSDATLTKGIISRLVTDGDQGRDVIQIDCDILRGNSGGPLVNENGDVLGVSTFFIADQSTLESVHYAVSIDEVITLLNDNGVEYQMSSGRKGTEDGQQGLDGKMVIIFGAFGVLLVLGVIILVYVNRVGKNNKNNTAAAEGFDDLKEKPYVRSIAMQHGELWVPIKGRIVIGRKKGECAIVYAEDTPGVSKKHCAVSFDRDSGDFILSDLNSTYGTFLWNGEKLIPGVTYRLRAGDGFYVGTQQNVLTVELRESQP